MNCDHIILLCAECGKLKIDSHSIILLFFFLFVLEFVFEVNDISVVFHFI